MAIIRPEQYVELYSELAELMLEANNGDLPSEILLVTDANGDERYTPRKIGSTITVMRLRLFCRRTTLLVSNFYPTTI